METKVNKMGDNQVELTITVEAAEVDRRIAKTYKEFANRYNFPGFRKGKAPRPVIDNALGKEAVPAKVTDDIINEYYPKAIDAEDLVPVGQPIFGDPEFVEPGKDFTFTAAFLNTPEYELSGYEPVEIFMPESSASDDEIEAELESLVGHYFTFEDAPEGTEVAEGATVELKIAATDDDGKAIDQLAADSRTYTLGSGMLPETFDAEIIGMKAGEKKTFKIDNAGSVLTNTLAGKTATITFDVDLAAIKEKKLPEITDAWVSENLGFDTVVDLRTRLAENIESNKAEVYPRAKENRSLLKLSERIDGEIPEMLVSQNETELLQGFFQQLQQAGMTFDQYLANAGMTTEQFKEDIKRQALDSVKEDLSLDAWARHYGMSVSDEEILEQFTLSGAENPAKLLEEWRESGRLVMLRRGILRNKACEDVLEKAIVNELSMKDFAEQVAAEAAEAVKKAEAEVEAKEAAKEAEKKAEEKAEKKAEKKPRAKKGAHAGKDKTAGEVDEAAEAAEEAAEDAAE